MGHLTGPLMGLLSWSGCLSALTACSHVGLSSWVMAAVVCSPVVASGRHSPSLHVWAQLCCSAQL